jgi:hypothetical protein
VRGAGFLVDDRHLSEEVAFAEHGEDHLPAILCDQDHLHLPGGDEIERITGIIIKNDDASLGISTFPGEIGKCRKVDFG